MNEHQPVLAQVSNDGAARLPPALPRVTVLKAGFVVWKFELDPPVAHCGRGVFTFFKSREIPQIPITVRSRDVVCQFIRKMNLEDVK